MADKQISFRVHKEVHKRFFIHYLNNEQYNSFQDFVLKSMENQYKLDKKKDAKNK